MVKVVAVVVVCFGMGVLATMLYEKVTGDLRCYFRNYRLHHSLFGVTFLIISAFMYLLSGDITTVISLIGFSVGNIVQHTRQDGFVFIEKDEKQQPDKMFVIRDFKREA